MEGRAENRSLNQQTKQRAAEGVGCRWGRGSMISAHQPLPSLPSLALLSLKLLLRRKGPDLEEAALLSAWEARGRPSVLKQPGAAVSSSPPDTCSLNVLGKLNP